MLVVYRPMFAPPRFITGGGNPYREIVPMVTSASALKKMTTVGGKRGPTTATVGEKKKQKSGRGSKPPTPPSSAYASAARARVGAITDPHPGHVQHV